VSRQLVTAFNRWLKSDSMSPVGPRKELVYVLDHEYTEASLSFGALKGADLIKATALQAVCDTYDICMFLATMERKVENSIVDDEGWGGRGRYDRYHDDSSCGCGESDCDDCCNSDMDGGANSVIEQISDDYVLQTLVDLDGDKIAEEIKIEKRQILPPHAFDDKEVDDDDRQYTGNEGATSTLVYNVSV
jgi:hypothetical protein